MAHDMGRTLVIAVIVIFAGSGAAIASDSKSPCVQTPPSPNCLERGQSQIETQRQADPRKDEKRPRRRCRYILM